MEEREHFLIAKTEALLNKKYWISNIRNKIQKVIGNCIPCILKRNRVGRKDF